MSPSSNDLQRSHPGAPAIDLDENREAVLDRLTEAFASDLVPIEDYESRVSLAQNARSEAELDASLHGLPAGAADRARKASAAREAPAARRDQGSFAPRAANPIDSRIAGSSSVACVMGDRTLNGDWVTGDQVGAFTLMGSTKLDLRDTALPPGRLKIDAFVLMGEIKIVVPRCLPVRMSAFPFMGEANASREVERRIEPDKPYVEVSGVAMMGSITVVAMDR
jgi:hypothetical protein